MPVIATNPRTFRCLNCNEMIDDSMTQCRYCSATVDPTVARLVAERQERASQSYSAARLVRMAVVVMYVFIVLSYIPFVQVLSIGIPITFFVVIVLLMRWQKKFGSQVTNDADYLKARRSWRLSLVLWLVAMPLGALGYLLLQLLLRVATR